jgi:hypothetical protein
MNDELNKIVIVNLSNDDDSTSIPTPTITTVKAVGTDLKSVDDNYSQKLEENILSPTSSIDINVNNSINEVSTETITNTLKNSTERVLMAEPFEDISYENNNDNENETLTNNDSSLSDIDLDQMISEQLNTDFTEVDLNSSVKDNKNSLNDNHSSDLLDEARPMLLQQIIDNVDNANNKSPILMRSTTEDIINSSLKKLNEENTVDEPSADLLNTSLDSSTESETSTESDSNDAVNIKIILSSPDNKETEVFNTEDIKIVVTDPEDVKEIIYPYHEKMLTEAVNKAIEKHKNKTKSPIKSKSKKHKKSKAKKSVRFNIENDNYTAESEVIPIVDENSIESLKKEIDRLNSRIVQEIKARTIIQHTLEDTIIETDKIKKDAVEKSDLKIRETMEYAHRLQESMDKRINKMQNESLEKYKEIQAAHDARLEEEREVWRQVEQDAKDRIKAEREEKDKILEENKRLEKVIEGLKAQIEEEASNSERFQLSVKQMLEEYEAKYKEEQQSRKNAEEVIDRVLEKSRDFQENIEDLKELNSTLKESNRELSERLSEATEKLDYKDKFIAELKSKMGDLNFTIEILKEESENNVQKIKILSSETQNITDRSIQEINEVKEENVSIYKLLDASTKKYDELQMLYNVKEEEVELLKKKVEQMNKKFKRVLRKHLIKGGGELSNISSPLSAFSNTSFEIMSNVGNTSMDGIGKGIKETPILGELNNTNVLEDMDENCGIPKHAIRKKNSNASISSTTLSISSLVMTSQNDINLNTMNMTPILPYGLNEVIKEEGNEEEMKGEIIHVVEESDKKPTEIDRRSSKDSNSSLSVGVNANGNRNANGNENVNSNDNDNNNNNNNNNNNRKLKKLELPKLTIQTSNDEIIESILGADDDSDDDSEEDLDNEFKQMNDGDISTMIEKRIMDFRTDDAEYLDFVEKLKNPSKIANAKFIKRCEAEEISGCLSFEGDYSGFFNNRKLWNNAKSGTILIEPFHKNTTTTTTTTNNNNNSTTENILTVSQPRLTRLRCALCSLRQKERDEIVNWFKFKACDTDPTYENICPYCRDKLANVCEWYSYLRLIQNKLIKKNPKLIYSDLLDIKRKLFYSKNGITFKFQQN